MLDMFQNRVKREDKNILPTFNPLPVPPRKKQFKTMYELLADAEKYDQQEEYDVSEGILKNLIKYIEEYNKL